MSVTRIVFAFLVAFLLTVVAAYWLGEYPGAFLQSEEFGLTIPLSRTTTDIHIRDRYFVVTYASLINLVLFMALAYILASARRTSSRKSAV